MKKKNLKKLLTIMLTLTTIVSSIPVSADSVSVNSITLSTSENSVPVIDEIAITDEVPETSKTSEATTETQDNLMLPNPFTETAETMTTAEEADSTVISENEIKVSVSDNDVKHLMAVTPDFTASQGDLNMHRFYSKGYSSDSDNFVYINDALAFFNNDNWYVTPSQVTDTQYIWPDGSVDEIASYQDYFYNNHMPIKYLKDIFDVDFSTSDFSCASGRLWTINDGTEFEWYELSSKTLYRTQKSSNGYEQIVDKVIPENDYTDGHYLHSESLMGGYAHGFYYYARPYSDSSKHMLFYDYDGVDYEEELSYRPKYMIDVVKDSLWYLASVDSSTKLVRHELGTDGGDTVIMTLSSYSYPRVIQLKGIDDKVILLAGGFTNNGSVSTISLSDNTYEAIGSGNFYCKLNADESVLTLNTTSYGPSLGDAGNYTITSRVYYTYDKDGLSEAKYHDDFWGTGSYYVAKDKSGNNGYVLPSTYGTLNFIGRIGIPSDLSYTAGYDKPVANGLNDFIRNYVYDGNIVYANLSTATSIDATVGGFEVKSDGNCEDGLYIETSAGREDLYTPSLTDPHCKKTTGRKIEDATCQHADIYTYDCARCDTQDLERYESGYIDPSQHTAFTDERNIVVPATCTTSGEYGYKCYNCNKDVYMYEYLYQGKNTINQTKRTEIRKTDSEGNVTVQSDTTYDDIKTIPATGHNYITIENIKYPTCSDDGLVKKQCIYCGETHEEVVSALNHDFVQTNIYEEPTCEHEGYANVKCNRCGLKIKKYRLPKADHDYELIDTQVTSKEITYGSFDYPDTTNVDEYKDTYRCKVCGNEYVKTHLSENMYSNHDFTGPVNVIDIPGNGDVCLSNTNDAYVNFYQSAQTLQTLSEEMYDKIKIDGQDIKTFLGTSSEAMNITPSTFYEHQPGYPLIHSFKNSVYSRSEGYTGTFDVYAYPDALDMDITTINNGSGSRSFHVSSDEFADNLPKTDKIYSVINITDSHLSQVSLELYGSSKSSTSEDIENKKILSKAKVYRLNLVDDSSFASAEIDLSDMKVYPNQDNFFLVVIEPDYDMYRAYLEDYSDNYEQPQPDASDQREKQGAYEQLLFGAKLVTSMTNEEEYFYENNIDPDTFTQDGLTEITNKDSDDNPISKEVRAKMKCSNMWHTYKTMLNIDGSINYMKGQYILHSFGSETSDSPQSSYEKGDYENSSNAVSVPVKDWFISNPVFVWYLENEDGTRSAISDGDVIGDVKFSIIDDYMISAETITNIDEPLQLNISCDITQLNGTVVKTYPGVLVFDNLEPELDITPDESLTVTEDNVIKAPKNEAITLNAAVKYLKEGTTDYVDTDETVNWYFEPTSTQKLYRIEANGSLTEVDNETFLPVANEDTNADPLLSAGANGNDLTFTPEEDGTLIARFTGRYGSTLKSTGISLYATLTSLVAVYNGDDIPVGEEYDKSDVEVTAFYHDGNSQVLANNDWTESSLIVADAGDNGYTATYGGLTANYTVIGTLIPRSLVATYKGDPVKTGENYNKDDVEVKVTYHTGLTTTLTSSKWTESGLTVTNTGNNDFTASYFALSAPFKVPGYKQGVDLQVSYLGDSIRTGDNYSKSDVEVRIVYHDNSLSDPLADNEWAESGLKVSTVGDNTFTATYGGLTKGYTVPGYKQETGIIAVYTGDPIRTGDNHSKADVKVQIKYHDGSFSEPLNPSVWTADSLLVNVEGDNNFIATYKTFTTDYKVPGYKQEVGIVATYEGAPIKVNNPYNKDDVVVKVKYHDGSLSDPILSSDWTESGLVVNKKNANDFTATYKTFDTVYTVTGYETEKKPIKIIAVYTGEDIPVGTDYKKEDVKVTVYYEDGSKRELGDNEWTDNGTLVKVVGSNDYIATYGDLTSDYSVTGILVPKAIKAQYKGPDIAVGGKYNKIDVEVRIIYHDDSISDPLPASTWKESSLIVSKAGDNGFTAYYEGLNTQFTVNGFAVPVKITAVYKGEPVNTGDDYDKDDVEVIVIYSDDSTKVIPSDEWTADKTLVTIVGKNKFKATYEGFTADFEITGIKTLTGISAIYKGKPIEVGKKYAKSDVAVYAIYHDGSKERLSDKAWKTSSMKIDKKGNNSFTATYKGFKDDYTIKGFETKLGDPVSYDKPVKVIRTIVKTGVDSYMNIALFLLVIAIILLAIYFKKRK